jgi:Zn-dependent protease
MRTINPGGAKYGLIEVRDIGISVLVLSIAFTIAFYVNGNDIEILLLFGMSAMIVLTSFVAHELAHKFVAQRYGAWAEYRLFPTGLLIALLISFTGFIFAAPGAVYIGGHIDDDSYGKTAAAGPATNIVISAIAAALAYMTTDLLSSVLWIMASINAFFAVFNMIPVSPFDGSKIHRWNPMVYIVMVAAAVCLLAFVWFF